MSTADTDTLSSKASTVPSRPYLWTEAVKYAHLHPPRSDDRIKMEAWARVQKTLHGCSLGLKRVARGRMKQADVVPNTDMMRGGGFARRGVSTLRAVRGRGRGSYGGGNVVGRGVSVIEGFYRKRQRQFEPLK